PAPRPPGAACAGAGPGAGLSAALRLEAKAGDLESLPADLAIVYKFKGQSDIGASVGERIARHLGEIARGDRFEGRAGRHLLWHAPPGEGLPSRRYLLLGLGRKEECTLEHYRRHVGEALVEADRLGATSVALPLLEAGSAPYPVREAALALAEGVLLGTYRFDRYRSEPRSGRRHLREIRVAVGDAAVREASEGIALGEVTA